MFCDRCGGPYDAERFHKALCSRCQIAAVEDSWTRPMSKLEVYEAAAAALHRVQYAEFWQARILAAS